MKSMSLEGLIYPHHKEIFLNEYFEEKPLLAKRRDKSFFDPLIKKSDINTLINKIETLGGINVFAKHPHRVIETNEYAFLSSYENVTVKLGVNPTALFNLLDSGTWFTFTSVQKVLPCIQPLYKSLRSEFLAHIQIQLVLTGKGDALSEAVFPQHDSFILQLDGENEINVFSPGIVLPLSNQHYFPNPQELQVQTKFTLAQGDCAYLPRGYGYQCVSGASITSQLRIHIYNTTWTKVVHDVIARIAHEEDVLRTGFGVPALKSINNQEQFINAIRRVLKEKLTPAGLSEGKERVRQGIQHEKELRVSEILEKDLFSSARQPVTTEK